MKIQNPKPEHSNKFECSAEPKTFGLWSKIQNKGFTLIELLVVIGIFSIVIGMVSVIFILGIRQQKVAFVSQTVLDQTSFALEFMSRALRMARKELSTPTCLSQNGLNYEITLPGSGLKFINSLENSDCQEFFLESGQLKYWKKSTGETLPLTSNKLEIAQLKFNLTGSSQSDDLQPAVTIFLEIRGKGDIESSQRIKIQATLSQRNLDVLQ